MDDWVKAPNIGRHPDVYEFENEALRRDGRLDEALTQLANPSGKRVLDIGCGTGFWLPELGRTAASVKGVEPDSALLAHAARRVDRLPHVEALAGSAEHLPFDADAFDVVQARFAYFFGSGAERGLAEVRRVLAPGGVFVAIDNADEPSDFTSLLADAVGGNADHDLSVTAAWWAAQGAERVAVSAGWVADSLEQLEQILRIEFPKETVDRFLTRHRSHALSYSMSLFVIRG